MPRDKLRFTENDLTTFRTVPPEVKARVMYTYLVGQPGDGINDMNDVAQRVLGGSCNSQSVSNITRGYGFSGQNHRKYKKGCAFEKRTEHEVTLEDIQAYVYEYPDGTFYGDGDDAGFTGESFEEFLERRIQELEENGGEEDYQEFSVPAQSAGRTASKPGSGFMDAFSSGLNSTGSAPVSRGGGSRSSAPGGLLTGGLIAGAMLLILLIFNVFSLRTKLFNLLADIVGAAWVLFLAVLFVMSLIDKVPFAGSEPSIGKRMIRFVIIGALASVVFYLLLLTMLYFAGYR